MKKTRRLLAVTALLASSLTAYLGLVWPWMMTWSATPDEIVRSLPGDDLIPPSGAVSTRAVTIHRRAEDIWPWLAQIGVGRGGFYSYDWLANLFGLNVHSADRILPMHQDLPPGTLVYGASPYWLGGRLLDRTSWRAESVARGRWIVLRGWGVLYLDPIDGRTTRLIVRASSPSGSPASWLMGRLASDPVRFIMERRMLNGVKERAEGTAAPMGLQWLSRFGFGAGALVVFLLLFVRHRGWAAVPLVAYYLVGRWGKDGDAAAVGLIAAALITLAVLDLRRSWRAALVGAGVGLLVLFTARDAFLTFGLLIDVGLAFLALRWLLRSRGTAAPSAPVAGPVRAATPTPSAQARGNPLSPPQWV